MNMYPFLHSFSTLFILDQNPLTKYIQRTGMYMYERIWRTGTCKINNAWNLVSLTKAFLMNLINRYTIQICAYTFQLSNAAKNHASQNFHDWAPANAVQSKMQHPITKTQEINIFTDKKDSNIHHIHVHAEMDVAKGSKIASLRSYSLCRGFTYV